MNTKTDRLIAPHGGTLVNRVVDADNERAEAQSLKSWTLTLRPIP